jgi:hypothetical protein
VESLGGIGHIIRVAERSVLDGVLQTGNGLTTKKIVYGAVLHDQNDDILDVGLQVVNGRRRVRDARLLGSSSRSSGEGQEANKSTGMHLG